MGVFVTGRQVALEIDMPGWWLANASVDMDFRRGLYYDSSTANPRAATDFLSCTRTSVGYAKNSDGTLTSFSSNALRIGVGTGLLVEDARTNSAVPSVPDGGIVWVDSGIVETVNNTTAPDGTTTATQLTETSSNAEHLVRDNISISAQTSYTVSGFVKAGTRGFAVIAILDRATNDRAWVGANLSTGAISGSGVDTVGSGFTLVSSGIETFTNGWYRLSLTATHASTGTVSFEFAPSVAGAAMPGTAYLGNGSYIYAWGAQIEGGSFATSYIPTTTVPATRAEDLIKPIGNLLTLWGGLATQSTVQDAIENSSAVSFWSGSILEDSGGTYIIKAGTDTSVSASTGTGITANFPTSHWTTGVKTGYAQDGSGRSIVGDGGTVVSDANQLNFSPTGNIRIGLQSYSYRRRITVWNSRLANATLQALTAP